jgi:CBS domain-containing protein
VTTTFKALPVMIVPTDAVLMQTVGSSTKHVSILNPAVDVMTDLRQKTAVTVEPNLSIENAELRMRNARVRLLFVLSESGDLIGLITLNDIEGMRPMRFQQEMHISRNEVLVRDVMTSLDKLEALDMHAVGEACVGDIIETLKSTGRQHAIVIERTPVGPAVRGIFSASSIGRQLGIQLDPSGVAWTFAELETALTH